MYYTIIIIIKKNQMEETNLNIQPVGQWLYENYKMYRKYYPIKLSKFLFMYFITWGLYLLYWMYKNWEYLKENNPKYKNTSPLLYAILFPVALIYLLLEKDFTFKKKYIFFISGLVLLIEIMSWIVGFWNDEELKKIAWFLYFWEWILFIPIIQRINILNKGIAKKKYDYWINSTNIFASILLIPIMIAWIAYNFTDVNVFWKDRDLNNQAITLNDQGKYEESILLYKKAIKVNPDEAMIHFNLWSAYLAIDDYPRALVSFDNALENLIKLSLSEQKVYGLTQADIYAEMWAVYFALWDYDSTKKYLDMTLKIDEDHSEGLYYMAVFLSHSWDLRESLFYIDKYKQNNEIDLDLNYTQADNYYFLWDYSRAVKIYLETKNYYSAWLSALYLKDYENALKYFDIFLKEDQSDSLDFRLLERNETFYIAYAYYLSWNYKEADKIFESIIWNDYDDIRPMIYVFYTLTRYELNKSGAWELYINQELDIKRLLKYREEIEETFFDKGLDWMDDFLHHNYIYLVK